MDDSEDLDSLGADLVEDAVAAVEAGAGSASKVGQVVSQLVIPRPVEELDKTFNK